MAVVVIVAQENSGVVTDDNTGKPVWVEIDELLTLILAPASERDWIWW